MRVALWAAVVAACCLTQPAWSNGGDGASGGRAVSDLQSNTVNLIGTGTATGIVVNRNFRIRLDSGLVRTGTKVTAGDEAHLRKRYSSSMIDYYPLGEGFRLSLGGRLDNRARGARGAASLANYLMYSPKSSSGVARGTPKRFAPAATMGFGQTIAKDMTIGIEAGALLVRGNPAMREFVRFARQGTDDNRFRMSGGSRFNPVAQVSFGLKF